MRLHEYPDREMLAMRLADKLASALENCLLVHDHASLCVPGGTSPGETFSLLSDADIDWSRVHVVLGDERWVPEDHERSNTRLVRETLLQGRAARARLVPMVSDAPTPEEGAPGLARAVEAELPISVLLLGMGEDGHTASLFPGDDAATADDAPPVVAVRPEGQEPRVTLSLRVLRGAMETQVLIHGEAKRATLDRARRDHLPIAPLLRDADVHWAP